MEPQYVAAHKVALATPGLAAHFMRIYQTESDRYHGAVSAQRHRLRAGPPITPMMSSDDMLMKARRVLVSEQAAANTPEARMLAALAAAERSLRESGQVIEQMRGMVSRGDKGNIAHLAQDASTAAMDASMQLTAASGLAEQMRVADYEATA